MPNVRKLLVPIDFSLESEIALRYASSLTEQIKGALIALHVIDELSEHDGLLPFIMHRKVGRSLARSRRPVRSMFY